jgi:hypothetical protein
MGDLVNFGYAPHDQRPPFGGLISFDASDAMIPQATSARDPESCANHIGRFGDARRWRPAGAPKSCTTDARHFQGAATKRNSCFNHLIDYDENLRAR